MSISDWNAEIIEKDQPFVGIATLKWKCTNPDEGIEEIVETKLDEEKIYPQEDFEYEGEINNKNVEGTYITGHGPIKSVSAVGDKRLSDAERVAGISHINWMK